jgi:putative intracellular protease/amidase
MPSLLIVLTGADHWTLDDDTEHPTGFWGEELVAPMRVFRDAGIDTTVATPGGVRPTVDEASVSVEGAGGDDQAQELRDELDALAEELDSPLALEDVAPEDYDGVFVPGGHGPMEDLAESAELGRLLGAMLEEDRVIAALGLTDIDGNLVTGQDPASSSDVARRTVERLEARAHWIHVVPHEGAWTFKHEHGEPEGTFRTQKQAIEAAREHGRAHGDWELVIHGRSGRIRDAVAIH